jgi:hypothetical protein
MDASSVRSRVKPLKWLVADMLAAHLDELVDVAGESLRHLPQDVKCALVAVARRRGCLDDAVLACLVEEGAAVLDVSGCHKNAVTDQGIADLARRGALRGVARAVLVSCALCPRPWTLNPGL